MSVTVDYDARAGYGIECPCGWSLRTASLYRDAVLVQEHLHVCRKTPPRPTPQRRAPGVRNGNSKVDAEKVVDIRQRYAAGERQRDIAADYGITQVTVGAIVRRETWTDVD